MSIVLLKNYNPVSFDQNRVTVSQTMWILFNLVLVKFGIDDRDIYYKLKVNYALEISLKDPLHGISRELGLFISNSPITDLHYQN